MIETLPFPVVAILVWLYAAFLTMVVVCSLFAIAWIAVRVCEFLFPSLK